MMHRIALGFVLLLMLGFGIGLAGPVGAQDAPTVTVEIKETEAIPGQPLTLRITVLVPTYMPKPPVWPSYEAPNLWVRLPEKSTTSTSQRIGGGTWAGLTRKYQISPMVPGRFTLPEAEMVVTWADPQTNAPRQSTLRVASVTLTGILPEGAEGLDPFVAATGLTLSQEIEGTPEQMVPGDSVVRTVRAEVAGSSAMFLPPLLAPAEVPGLRVYPDEPQMELKDERGVLSGERRERVTFVAEGGGAGMVPGVTLAWFNLESGKVETATLDGFAVHIDGPPVLRAQDGWPDWVLPVAVAALLVAVLGGLALWMRAPFGRWLAARRARYRASEAFGWAAVQRAVRARDLGALYPALDLWSARAGRGDLSADPAVQAALLQLGQARYGVGTEGSAQARQAWQALAHGLRAARPTGRGGMAGTAGRAGLPDLN